jgi:RNA polymerase sigma factor (sigma-70 family)
LNISNSSNSTEKLNQLHEDRQLWDGLKKGETQALEKLFRIHYPLLYNYGLKISKQEELVKDSIQEIFAYIWEKRENLAFVESIAAYLLVSLRRHLLHALAKQQRRQNTHKEFGIEEMKEVFSVEDLIIFAESENAEKQALKAAFKKIPPRIREALYLKTYNGLTYKEIAKIMNVNPQVARNYVSEAFQRLRGLLTQKD